MTTAVRPGGPELRGKPVDDWQLKRSFPVMPGSVRAARALAGVVCRRASAAEACDAVTLVVSELVGNAVRHTRSATLTLRLSVTPRRLRLEVVDDDPGTPEVRRPDETAENGRGMWLVTLVAVRWGVEPRPPGKVVWVEIALPVAV